MKNLPKIGIALAILSSSECLAQGVFDQHFDHIDYLTKRDEILSRNIANADTPKYKPKELKLIGKSSIYLPMSTTSSGHMSLDGIANSELVEAPIREVKPNGNAVNLDDELFKKSENATRLQEAMGIYNKSRSMLRTAIRGNK